MESLPASMNQLSRLSGLYLNGCKKLQELPEISSEIRDLRANDCPSLRTIWSSSKCNKFAILSFKNCFKLIENKQNNIRIENFLLNQFQRNSCGRNCFSIVLPGREIPKWFSHQSRGCWISFQLPPHWFNNSFLGFAFAAVGISNKYKPLLIAMRFKRRGTQRIITKCSKCQITSLPAVDFGNLPVRYVPRSEFLRNVEDDMEQLNEDGIEFQACLFEVCRNCSSGEYQLALKAAERYCFGENGWEGKNFIEVEKFGVCLVYKEAKQQALSIHNSEDNNNMGVFHGDLDRSARVQVASSATTSKRRRDDLNDNDYDAAAGSSGSPGIDDQEDLLNLNSKRLRL